VLTHRSACVIGMVGIYFRVLLLTEPDFTWLCTKAAMLVYVRCQRVPYSQLTMPTASLKWRWWS
jgi:hypothetical protein